MQFMKKLPEADEIATQFPLSGEQKKVREEIVVQVKNILSGKDRRKVLLIGPCSADREDAVVDYIFRLAGLQERIKEK